MEELPLGDTTVIETWDERVGMADRGMVSERFDALWCKPALKEADLVPVPISVVPSATERDVEVIVAEGVARKVRYVNDLILNTGKEEQRCTLAKARGKSHRRKVRPILGDGEAISIYSLSDSDFQARQAEILCEAEATV
ncbi:hypothetical protein V6N12_005707 [Hibiscus sabdariffa]|uniref:Uncharacterized protein n=1 Tax=Hibiscus sabdariffa TaxID=183260 RepID=A0ABR2B2C8_9ROSI